MTTKIYTIDEIKLLLTEVLKNSKVKKATLFGSYAKGNPNKNSDIDLLIDSNNTIVGLEFYDLLYEIEEKLNKNVDLIEKKELIKNGKVEKEIKKTGVVVYG